MTMLDFEQNLELNCLEARARKVTLDSKPTQLMTILTRACNLRCIMCPQIRYAQTALPLAQARKIAAAFPWLKWINWQGGEVFLVDYFAELFSEAARHPHLKQHIITNGLLIDRHWAELFSRSKVDLLISIDAVTKALYESIRLGASFDDLLRSLELIDGFRGDSGNRLDLSVVVMRRNFRTLEAFPDFCRRYHFTSLRFNYLAADTLPGEDIIIRPDAEACAYLREAIPRIRACCREYNIEFECMFSSRADLEPAAGNRAAIAAGGADFATTCPYPWTRLFVDSDGDIRPGCECAKSLGNLKSETLDEAWNSATMRSYRTLLAGGRMRDICSQQCLLAQDING